MLHVCFCLFTLDTINDKTEDKEETVLFRSYESIAATQAEKEAKEAEEKENSKK